MEEVQINKSNLRKQMRFKRNSLDPTNKMLLDGLICEKLMNIILERKSLAVHTYLPMDSEIDLLPVIEILLHKSITVVCPKTLPNRKLENRILVSLNELEDGPMKTQHPQAENVYTGTYDLIIVPGLAFDKSNYRLGYGGGYYDDFLCQHPEALKVGVFYDFQKVDAVPREAHDLDLDVIVTPKPEVRVGGD